ncbi:MAG TPA: alpha-amylase family glycosyl hydrolase [Ornithinibacter sp.]|nr:alpha-amylase family glycosyl hydrolase [Ornithinibacter sp.]
MPGPRRLFAVLVGSALVAAPVVGAVPAEAETSSVAVVGSLQDELGCPGDWDPACPDTELTQVGETSVYAGTFELPGGSYEYKVALNDSWDENYGAGGAFNGANLPLLLAGPTTVQFTFDDDTNLVSFAPADLDEDTTRADRALAEDSLRSALTRERFYFVMADRFANGSTDNDLGGLTGGPLTTGFDPTHKGFYHGGDLKGISQKLDYIKDMGTTAIWLTPSFKNKPVQGGPGQESAGYHGYWITDFTQIDPHLGTNEDMKELIDAAHAKGMKVFFDIITNHTADVIDYEEQQYTYRSKKTFPYEDTDGNPFDDRDYVGKPAADWPEMDEDSFPYTPFLHDGDEKAKTPNWLNDPLMYHNRGDSTFAGESSTYGDFIGLDDLFTERPEVVKGMGEIYKTWVDFGIDGFRIDTVKHVNLEFWQEFVPDILGEAERIGNDDFFAFGEVYDGNPAVMSEYTTAGKLQATLDFGFQQQGVDFAKGNPANVLGDFFAKDDWYTDADSNAYQLPTFLGNHDMGRASMFLERDGQSEAEHLARVELAQSLMFTTRGNPVTYYGDEQGFVSTGGDQAAREDMFASEVELYNTEKVLGGPEGSMDRYDTDHPLYEHISNLSALRQKHPGLADGAQVNRYAAEGAGIFAVSRIGEGTKGGKNAGRVEYVVAANNDTTAATATFPTWTKGPGAVFTPVLGGAKAVRPAANGSVKVTVPPLSVSVWKANKPISTSGAAPTVEVVVPDGGAYGRAEIRADVGASTFAQTTFLWRQLGADEWQPLGTDDNAPFRVFHDVSGLELATPLEYRAVVKDAGGRVAGDSSWVQVVEPPSQTVPELGDPAASQPGTVAIAGTLNSEMGCAADWDPACDQAQMVLDADDQIWKKRDVTLPAGPYAYKAALNRSWTENYGEAGVRDGGNISLETADGRVSFYYDPTTHWVVSDEQDDIITVPGSFQSELGCEGDWQPDCMRPWLQDKDGDGVYAIITTRIPAGTWEFKVAHGLSMVESYPAANLSVTVPTDGATTTFLYDSVSHEVTVTSG